MTGASWFAGFLVLVWLMGYGVGHIFLSIRRFVEKDK